MIRSAILVLTLSLAACSHLTPYQMDIRQGNLITPEMREKLKLGMSKQQVRYVMGTPLLADAFHENRWDYEYSLAQRGKLAERQGMTLYFEGDNLARIDDAAMPHLPAQTVAEPVPQALAASAVPVVMPEPVASVPAAVPQVQASLDAWAAAWSARDGKAYLAAYAPTFKPEGMSYSAWQKQRLQRIAQAKSIAVTLSEVAVQMQDDSHAMATFTQHYHADGYQDVVHKSIKLEKSGDAWLIVAETVQK